MSKPTDEERHEQRTARAAAQWERIQRAKGTHPFLLFLLGNYGNPPPEHAAWHGLLLPVDHVFWKTHLPPVGKGCKCSVRQVSVRDAEKLVREGVRSGVRKPILDAKGLPTGHHEKDMVPVRRTAPRLPAGTFIMTASLSRPNPLPKPATFQTNGQCKMLHCVALTDAS